MELAAAAAIRAIERAGFAAGSRSGAAAHFGAGAGRMRANREVAAATMREAFEPIGVKSFVELWFVAGGGSGRSDHERTPYLKLIDN